MFLLYCSQFKLCEQYIMEMKQEQNRKLSFAGIAMWLIVAIFYGLDYLQHTIPSVLILPISKSIGVDYTTIVNTMNIYFPIYAICQIPSGYIIDKLGLKLSLFTASLILSAGLLLMATNNLHYITVGRALIAAGSAFAWNGGLKAAASYLPDSCSLSLVPISSRFFTAGAYISVK